MAPHRAELGNDSRGAGKHLCVGPAESCVLCSSAQVSQFCALALVKLQTDPTLPFAFHLLSH